MAPRIASLLLIAAAFAACRSTGAAAPTDAAFSEAAAGMPAQPEGTAPTPYSALEIARAHPRGTYTEYRLTSEGRPALLQRTEWKRVTAEGCEMVMSTRGPDGAVLGNPQSAEAQWWELRDHAALPEDEVEISDARVRTEAGEFDCRLYVHEVVGDGTRQTMRLWFDKKSAGSPVLFTTEVNGKETLRMELVSMNRLSLR